MKIILIGVAVAAVVIVLLYPLRLAAQRLGTNNTSIQACAIAIVLVVLVDWGMAIFIEELGAFGGLMVIAASSLFASLTFMKLLQTTFPRGAALALINIAVLVPIFLFLGLL